jgi:poly-gamma-glutamate synthesis protein (capsule biosynthesis protein)
MAKMEMTKVIAACHPGRIAETCGMITLLLAGDVMLGRGIDQILAHPGDPVLHEDYMKSALGYVRLAEEANGPIPRGVELSYVWGDAEAVLRRARADFAIANLETAIADRGSPEPKGINYRMHPGNAPGLSRLGIDCWVLSNNHMLDWGADGLVQTLDTIRALNIAAAGAGADAAAAATPAILTKGPGRRVLVFAYGAADSGVSRRWAARHDAPGLNLLDDFGARTVAGIAAQIAAVRRKGDIAVASLHWGGNWGYDIAPAHRRFARALIDEAGVDLVHGHSSHHPKGFEVYRDRLVLYGCGDFINDYEGIRGHEEYRSDLVLMFLAELDEQAEGRMTALAAVPFRIARFRLNRATADDAQWLAALLTDQRRGEGGSFRVSPEGLLRLRPA